VKSEWHGRVSRAERGREGGWIVDCRVYITGKNKANFVDYVQSSAWNKSMQCPSDICGSFVDDLDITTERHRSLQPVV